VTSRAPSCCGRCSTASNPASARTCLLCWLALLLIRLAERRTGLTWRRLELELGRLHAVTLSGSAGTVVQTTPLTDAQATILRACQVAPPPRVTTLAQPDLHRQPEQRHEQA
jgi:hypothetical protein